MPRKPMPIAERLALHARFDESGRGCILWTGADNGKDYGVTGIGSKCDGTNRSILAHRLVWQIANGSQIPDGLDVLHSCDVRRCCNPAHLFLGTQADNAADMVAKGRNRRGEQKTEARLTEERVREIRTSDETLTALAKRFGVGLTTVHHAKHRTSWAWLR